MPTATFTRPLTGLKVLKSFPTPRRHTLEHWERAARKVFPDGTIPAWPRAEQLVNETIIAWKFRNPSTGEVCGLVIDRTPM